MDRLAFAAMNVVRRVLFSNPHLLMFIGTLYGLRYGCRAFIGPGYIGVKNGAREIRLSLAHAPYLRDVIRQFDYYFNSVKPEFAGVVGVADFSVPRFHILPGLEIEFFFNSLPEAAESNEAYMQCFNIKEGDIIIDAGAYCGLTAYLFSKAAGPAGKVVAVEADRENFDALQKNTQRVSAGNIILKQAALWKEEGTLAFVSEGNMGSSVKGVGNRAENVIEVAAITLEKLCADCALSRVDHVKIDIEGSEYHVLPAAGAFIDRYRPDFVIEVHQNHEGVVDTAMIAKLFTDRNYVVRRVQQAESEILPLLHCVPREKAQTGGAPAHAL